MQILFVHPNYPAQFGPALGQLASKPDVECFFVTRRASGTNNGVHCIPYKLKGGATRATHYCSRTFENAVWQAHAVYEACKATPRLRPDVIVGHSGFGSTAMLAELYDCPIVNLFEYYYHPHGSDMDFRPDYGPAEMDFLRARMRNAMILIDLQLCAAGYAPTEWQRSLLPAELRDKVRVIHDGVDTVLWRRREVPRKIGDEVIPEATRIVTYVSRGFEAMRGFDIFVRTAKRIVESVPDVLFVCVGSDRVHYGNDLRHIEHDSFRKHVLATEKPDLECFRFPGTLPPEQLAELLSLSDLHVYLTVPFVVSWSLLNALACECLVLASDTAPVKEFVRHGENGLLADFFDVEGLAALAVDALRRPGDFGQLRVAGRQRIDSEYSVERTFPELWTLFEEVCY